MWFTICQICLNQTYIFILLINQCIESKAVETDDGADRVERIAGISVVVPVTQLSEARQVPLNDIFLRSYPRWVNETLLGIGQAFTRNNFMEFTYATVMSIAIVADTDVTRLLLGAANVMNPDKARKRYLSDSLHFKYWSVVDLDKNPNDLFESLNLVHAIHAKVVHNTSGKSHRYNKPIIPNPKLGQDPYNVNLAVWDAFETDLRNSRFRHLLQIEPQSAEAEHPPVNQFAFVSSFWAFVHSFIVAPEHVFIYNASEEQLIGFLHYWAFIGAAMGIDDNYNICLQPNLQAAKQYYTQFMEIHVLPRTLHWDYEYKVFGERTLKALQELIPFAPGPGGLMYRACEDLLHIQCPNVYAALSPQERMYNMFFGLPAHQLLQFKSIKSFVGFIWNGLVQIGAIKEYNYNTLNYANFTAGLHAMDEENLKASYKFFFHHNNDTIY